MKDLHPINLLILLLCFCGLSMAQAQPQAGDAQLEQMQADYRNWTATMEPHACLVEFDPAADAIGVKDPRFSWVVNLEGQGRMQSAYQIQVATAPGLLNADKPDMWDSGVVQSGQSTQVAYNGQPLRSNTEYFWRVRVRDESEVLHAYRGVEAFSTALLEATDWKAKWIGRGRTGEVPPQVDWSIRPKAGQPAADLRSPLFRKEFTIDRPVRRARLFVAGMGLYEARLNGGRVGDRVLTPTKTDYQKRILYDTYDVSKELRTGKNAIGAMLGNGWFNTPEKWWGWRMQWYGLPRLVLQLEISYMDGTSSRILSDESWRSALGPVTFSCIYDGEDYDSRLEQAGWDQPGFNDSHWDPANGVASPGGTLISNPVQPEVATEVIHPLTVEEPRPGVYVFDMGRNFSGWARIRAQGTRGTAIKLRFAEALLPDGTLNRLSLGPARAEDNFILKGGGIETHEPHFTFHGFQYVEVTGYPGIPALNDLEGRFVHNGVKPAGFFECGNDIINRIHLCTVQSQRCNLQMGVPTDCPQRAERLGWGADGWLSAQQAMLNFDMPRIYDKWMRDFHDEQLPSGLVGMIAPRAGVEEDLVWSAAYIVIPWYQYLQYGDKRILKDHYASLVKYMDYLESQGRSEIIPRPTGTNPLSEPAGQGSQSKGHLQRSQWGDHLSLADGFAGRSGLPFCITTAVYYYDACIMARIADTLDHKQDSRNFSETAAKIKEAFNARFFNAATNSYDNGTQAPQAFALSLGLVPEGHEAGVLKTLLDDIHGKHDGHLTTGYPGTKSLVDAIAMAGRHDVLWNLTQLADFPSWGDMLRGHTTVLESWSGGSFNHPVLTSAIDSWFYTSLAGIQVDESDPAFANILIKPYIPKDLNWVTARISTIHGQVSSAWRVVNNTLTLEVAIPANTRASVQVPCGNLPAVKVNDLQAGKAEGVISAEIQGKVAAFRIGSGNYVFTFPSLR